MGNVQKQLSAKRAWALVTTENRVFRAALEKIAALTAARADAFSRTLHGIASGALAQVREQRDKAA